MKEIMNDFHFHCKCKFNVFSLSDEHSRLSRSVSAQWIAWLVIAMALALLYSITYWTCHVSHHMRVTTEH